MNLSVIILTMGDRPAELKRAVDSALAQEDVDVEVVLVGNGADASAAPTTYNFNSSWPLRGPAGVVIARNWSSLWGPSSVPALESSFAAAGSMAPGTRAWSGLLYNGATYGALATCSGWSSGSGPGTGTTISAAIANEFTEASEYSAKCLHRKQSPLAGFSVVTDSDIATSST